MTTCQIYRENQPKTNEENNQGKNTYINIGYVVEIYCVYSLIDASVALTFFKGKDIMVKESRYKAHPRLIPRPEYHFLWICICRPIQREPYCDVPVVHLRRFSTIHLLDVYRM